MFVRLSMAVLVCGLSACTEDVQEPTLGEVVVGSSQADGNGFVPVANGTDVELVPGSQGGFHVWINVSVHGTAGDLYISHEARRVSDEALILRGTRQAFSVPPDAMDDWWDKPTASPAFMCPSPLGIKVFDDDILYTVRITDADDQLLATDEVILVPHCPVGDQNDFCVEICSG